MVVAADNFNLCGSHVNTFQMCECTLFKRSLWFKIISILTIWPMCAQCPFAHSSKWFDMCSSHFSILKYIWQLTICPVDKRILKHFRKMRQMIILLSTRNTTRQPDYHLKSLRCKCGTHSPISNYIVWLWFLTACDVIMAISTALSHRKPMIS